MSKINARSPKILRNCHKGIAPSHSPKSPPKYLPEEEYGMSQKPSTDWNKFIKHKTRWTFDSLI